MVSATGGNSRKEKSRNSAHYLRIEKGLKKKAFELSTLVGVDVCMIIIDPEQHGQATTDYSSVEPPGTYPDNSQEVHRIIQRYREYITTTTSRDEKRGGVSSTTTGVLGGKKKRRTNGDLIQKKPAEVLVTSSSPSSEQNDALLKGGSMLQNFKTEQELENEFMEELRNELMGFDEQNVNINNQLHPQEMTEGEEEEEEEEEEENLMDSSSEFLVEGDHIWSSDQLHEMLNGFGDNADHDHHCEDNMFNQLSPLSEHPPLPLTNAFIDNILNSTSDNWPAGTMVEWDQLFI